MRGSFLGASPPTSHAQSLATRPATSTAAVPAGTGTNKGVGPGLTLAWPGWKQPDIPVEVDTDRLESDVGRQEFYRN